MSPLASTRSAWSLQKRLLLAFGVLLILFLGFAGFVVDQAYKQSVAAAVEERLPLHIFALMGAAEEDQSGIFLTDLEDERFTKIDSGFYGLILDSSGQEIWRSPSALNLSFDTKILMLEQPETGETVYGSLQTEEQGELVWASYGTSWESVEQNFSFVALESTAPSAAQIREFQSWLSLWFGGLALILSVAQYILLRWGMQPLQQLASDVSAIESGNRDQLQGHYPSELKAVTNNLNMLIKNERERQGRYRTTLGDLAHSLKTPLAVMSTALQESRNATTLPPEHLREMQEQLSRMYEIICITFKPAVKSNVQVLAKPVLVAAVMQKLLAALGKVYKDKAMQVVTDIADNAVFYGEESDLLELCGNLLDNAFKYGRSRIGVRVKQEQRRLTIDLDDDGEGIAEQDRHWVLQRGARADTVTTGQGIGLAVAVEIVSAYGGEMQVSRNEWGGARFSISFERS